MMKEIKEVITRDGSVTWYDETTGEHYHSLAGAYEEALKKHAGPALEFLKINNRLKGKVSVLDYCFGLGYNSLVFLEEVRKIDKDIFVDIIGIDNDPEVVQRAKQIFKSTLDNYIYLNDKCRLEIKIGDAAEETMKLEGNFDVCFFDPFSPKKKPHLWDTKVFSSIYQKFNNNSILTTYSCARQVRDNMKEAGFIVKDGPTIGRWCPATIGIKNVHTNQ